jgi:peptidoglycan-N-acetylglucosamine deacetylase
MSALATRPRWYYQLRTPAVYLTYDDGPNPDVTPAILDILGRANAKAAFFLSGHSLQTAAHVACVRAAARAGHGLGNHGLVHRRDESPRFHEMQDRIAQIAGMVTTLIRPPYGLRTLARTYLAEEPAAEAFLWSACFRDWEPLDLESQPALLPRLIAPGRIVLLHDGSAPGDAYCAREHVIALTQMVVDYCGSAGLPLRSLAAEFPHAYGHAPV